MVCINLCRKGPGTQNHKETTTFYMFSNYKKPNITKVLEQKQNFNFNNGGNKDQSGDSPLTNIHNETEITQKFFFSPPPKSAVDRKSFSSEYGSRLSMSA